VTEAAQAAKRICLVAVILMVTTTGAGAGEILSLDHGTISIGVPTTFPDSEGNEVPTNFSGAILKIGGPRIAIVAAQNSIFTFRACGFGCAPGQSDSFGWGAVDWGSATVTLDGVSHPSGPGFAGIGGDGLYLSAAVDVAAPPASAALTSSVTFPYAINPVPSVLTRFVGPVPDISNYTDYGLQGSGHWTVQFKKSPTCPDLWFFDGAIFTLEPTPEPATLLLWGTAAAGFSLTGWIKRRRQAEPSRGT